MKIALFGATGQTGRRVLDECLARGWHVAALVREPSRVAAADIAVIPGDARDEDAVRKAVRGSDAVIICLGMHDITRAATDFSDAVKAIVRAMQTLGVRRIVAIASAGVLDHPAGGLRNQRDLPAFLANVAAEHTRNYETLRTSGLDWTLMCPVDLKTDIEAGHARWQYDDLPAGSSETGYADLARTMVGLVGEPNSHGHRVGIVSDRPSH